MEHLKLAIIGSGASTMYCLQHIVNHADALLTQFQTIAIFEKNQYLGFGMPYNPATTDKFNLSNITSEEIPKLPQTFADWLRDQDNEFLKSLNVTDAPIQDTNIYSRIALGHYFHNQFNMLIAQLKSTGFSVETYPKHEVKDIVSIADETIKIITNHSEYNCNRVVISTGHNIPKTDKPEIGYFESPWPIKKIIPKPSTYYTFEIGLLGASLSAFDVVTSLSHRHGSFQKDGDKLHYILNPKAEGFKITLHAAEGWLPHLQYEQEEPLREIYRHCSREKLLSLRNHDGTLNIDTFFNTVCKPALIKAFSKDKNKAMVKHLKDDSYSFKNFIETMVESHEYVDCFDGMKKELPQAKDSVIKKNPIHWMETLDDLMYALNYHIEWLSAEDNLFFNKTVKPFLMSVIAALPLESAKILLALHEAKVIDLVAGKVSNIDTSDHKTRIKIEHTDRRESTKTYRMFVNCAGSDTIELEQFPFKSLTETGLISKAATKFENDYKDASSLVPANAMFKQSSGSYLLTGGIAVDSAYRIIGTDSTVSPHIYDIAFTHIHGIRPYSYGLQACNATAAILITCWVSPKAPEDSKISAPRITDIYASNPEL